MASAALVGVTTGVMKPLLSKLTKLLEEEYVKLKIVRQADQVFERRVEGHESHA